jgi:acetyl esterase/lipase
MAPLVSNHPFKAIYTLAFIVITPPYLVALSLLYTFKSHRLVRSWSLKKAIGNEFFRLFFSYASYTRLKPSYANASKLRERYVLVRPGAHKLYTGILDHRKIKPTSMPAIWLPTLLSDPATARVVIHFQGGAFVLASDPVQTGTPPAKIFKEELGATTFYAQYRLARDDESRFPAAIQDAVSFYQHVLDQGVRPENILISGDSAGGSVAIGLIRYVESTKILPSPRGVMLWSPWVDVSDTAIAQHSKNKNLRIDFLSLGLLKWGVEAYEPASDDRTEETDHYLRPVAHPFRSHTPIFVNAGSAELLHDEISLFVEKMRGVSGNEVCYVETADAMHDVLLCGGVVGFENEVKVAVKEAGAFFRLAE